MRLLLDGSSIGVDDDEGERVDDDDDGLSFWRLEEPTESMRLLLDGSSIGVDDDRDETVEDDDSTMLVGASALEESSEHAAKLKKMLAAIGAKIL
jgi:hypothetical protein